MKKKMMVYFMLLLMINLIAHPATVLSADNVSAFEQNHRSQCGDIVGVSSLAVGLENKSVTLICEGFYNAWSGGTPRSLSAIDLELLVCDFSECLESASCNINGCLLVIVGWTTLNGVPVKVFQCVRCGRLYV